jgi:hypothetical protein
LNFVKSWIPFLQGGTVEAIAKSPEAARNRRFALARTGAIVIVVAGVSFHLTFGADGVFPQRNMNLRQGFKKNFAVKEATDDPPAQTV